MKNKFENIARTSALILVVVFFLGIFVSCGGLPASGTQEESTKKQWTVEDLPTPPSVDFTGTAVPKVDNDIIEPEYTARYAASSESDKYHRPSCHYVDQILYENLIYFYSKDSAHRAGYSPCSVCEP